MIVDKMRSIRHSIVASIPACHAGDQGSIPCDGGLVLLISKVWIISSVGRACDC